MLKPCYDPPSLKSIGILKMFLKNTEFQVPR